MISIRRYGNEPYTVAVIHGGPGAPGGMRKVAEEISKKFGVIEPMQSASSISGQVAELKDLLKNNAYFPVTLIGHSWGAWLSYIFAVKYPELVKKLILIGSGSFEEKYVSSMKHKRINRLTEEENSKVGALFMQLNDPNNKNKKEALCEFGELMSKADSYAPIVIENEALDFQPEVFHSCMKEVNSLRSSGELLNMGKDLKCSVVAIHGEYDSHSYEGVEEPLSKALKYFKFVLLRDCGHTPWNETYARDEFYKVIFKELEL
ncbi:MAG: alpha/beta hydrolase [Clostridiaceae bacterium]|nr:alpha/beta hydrolase [Clostridiaceae bacterium]